jgi:hypothetical protein
VNYVRVIIFSVVVYIAFFQALEQIASAFGSSQIIKIDGLINIWTSNAGLLVGAYMVAYSINSQFGLSLKLGEINKVLLLSCVLIAPLLSIGTYTLSLDNVSDYVECKNERRVSTRFSSRTYAVSTDICESLNPK